MVLSISEGLMPLGRLSTSTCSFIRSSLIAFIADSLSLTINLTFLSKNLKKFIWLFNALRTSCADLLFTSFATMYPTVLIIDTRSCTSLSVSMSAFISTSPSATLTLYYFMTVHSHYVIGVRSLNFLDVLDDMKWYILV